jgi:hypothetical protein
MKFKIHIQWDDEIEGCAHAPDDSILLEHDIPLKYNTHNDAWHAICKAKELGLITFEDQCTIQAIEFTEEDEIQLKLNRAKQRKAALQRKKLARQVGVE